MPNFSLATESGSNLLSKDPDGYTRVQQRLGGWHTAHGGRRKSDQVCIHYTFHLRWNWLEKAQADAISEVLEDGDLLYFDDGEVPPLVQQEYVYDTATYTFSGISNPSSTHKAYKTFDRKAPDGDNIDADSFQDQEFTTAEYGAVDADDDNYVESE